MVSLPFKKGAHKREKTVFSAIGFLLTGQVSVAGAVGELLPAFLGSPLSSVGLKSESC